MFFFLFFCFFQCKTQCKPQYKPGQPADDMIILKIVFSIQVTFDHQVSVRSRVCGIPTVELCLQTASLSQPDL